MVSSLLEIQLDASALNRAAVYCTYTLANSPCTSSQSSPVDPSLRRLQALDERRRPPVEHAKVSGYRVGGSTCAFHTQCMGGKKGWEAQGLRHRRKGLSARWATREHLWCQLTNCFRCSKRLVRNCLVLTVTAESDILAMQTGLVAKYVK